MIRLILAATMGASYGIYGPPFELIENAAVEPGKEEYLNSEKYEIKVWDREEKQSIREFVGRINAIRQQNPALQRNWGITFCQVDNERIVCYFKNDLSNLVLTVVNLDPYYIQSGWVDLPLTKMGLDPDTPFQVHDLLNGSRYVWSGKKNYVKLDPHTMVAHIFVVRKNVHTEQDFDYYG